MRHNEESWFSLRVVLRIACHLFSCNRRFPFSFREKLLDQAGNDYAVEPGFDRRINSSRSPAARFFGFGRIRATIHRFERLG